MALSLHKAINKKNWIIRTEAKEYRWEFCGQTELTLLSPREDASAGYAIDDQTAIKVINGIIEVVSEGHYKLFTP
jgi:hypothetical protein